MSFVILRTAKLKTAGSIGGSLGHNFRIMDTPNANDSKTHLNEHEFSLEEIKQNIENRLPEKVRSNGVRVIEYMISASPEWDGWGTDREKQFFDNAKRWLKEKHGSENVCGLSIHRDESTPHLIAYVVPIDPKGALNARHFLGGRKVLSDMQTSFADQVKDLGLSRGIEGSRAKHTTVKQFYAEKQKLEADHEKLVFPDVPLPPKSGFFESAETYGSRVKDLIENEYEESKLLILKDNNFLMDENIKLKRETATLKYKLSQAKDFFEYQDLCDDSVALKLRKGVAEEKAKRLEAKAFEDGLKKIQAEKIEKENRPEPKPRQKPTYEPKPEPQKLKPKRDDSLDFGM